MSRFPRERFQLRHSKMWKKLKNAPFRRLQYSFLSLRKLQNYFLRRFLWPNFDLNSFWCFASLSQLCYSKICKKLKNIIFVVELEVASKQFSNVLPRTKLWFKQFWKLCLAFPENAFNFATQKFAKNWKMALLEVHKIWFWPESSFKHFLWTTLNWKSFNLFASLSPKNSFNLLTENGSGDSVASKVSF